MPGQEELAMRLQALEDSYNNDKRVAREQQFMSDYGNMFSNHLGLGRVIMAELDNRGVDTSAAKEAVAGILNEMRAELNELSALVNAVQDTVVEKTDQIDTLAENASRVLAEDPDATTEPEMSTPEPTDDINAEFVPQEEPMPEMAGDPNAEFVPQEEPMPQEGPMPEMTGDPNAEFVPQEEPMPDTGSHITVSDVRMKNVRAKLNARRAARKPSYKPSNGVISAAMGGN